MIKPENNIIVNIQDEIKLILQKYKINDSVSDQITKEIGIILRTNQNDSDGDNDNGNGNDNVNDNVNDNDNIDIAKDKTITKDAIIELFHKNVKGKKPIKTNNGHDGQEGHWLETSMGLSPNSNNAPDIGGYEMKKNASKISFGDWSGEYLFSTKKDLINQINGNEIIMKKEEFIKYFGNKSIGKDNRYSWSGSCIPKYGIWNDSGQILKINENNNILILYSYDRDKRQNKTTEQWKGKEICIVVWSKVKMEKHVNDKFNQKGFFICKKNKANQYDKICFGPPINYELFISKIKTGDIFFDSGMYYDTDKPNTRLYSQWRASKKFWNDLLIEEF